MEAMSGGIIRLVCYKIMENFLKAFQEKILKKNILVFMEELKNKFSEVVLRKTF